jgi:diguanylate cyclase (GGDEF)-like protein
MNQMGVCVSQESTLSDVLTEFARTMVTNFPIQRILDRLVERIVDVLPIDAAGVSLIAPGLQPRYVAASNDAALRYETLQSKIGEGPCVVAFETGEPVAIPDLRLEDRFSEFTSEALSAGLVAVFTFPLKNGDHQLGALDLYRTTPGPLSNEALQVAQTLADVAAAYLLNAQAREDLIDASAMSRDASLHDPLTGLPNRVLMMDRIEHAFLRSRRSGTLSAVFFLDLDRFKSVNDMYGHKVGDALLVAVANRLTHLLRPSDTLARLSGDEFVILCEGLDNPAQATAVASRLDSGLEKPFDVAGHTLNVSTSVGVAFADHNHHDPEQVLHYADTAMYRAKHQGGGRLHVFDPSGDDTEVGLERDLKAALARGGELRTEYQPIVATTTGQIIGFEALLRWDHPTRGPVPPSVTIPIAERSGLIIELGQWVLDQAWTSWKQWHHMLDGAELTMAVNVSPHQLMSVNYIDTVTDLIGSSGTDIYSLTLEVTENAFVYDRPRALVVMSQLKELGVSLALDDFGTGYSSLSYLRQFPIDILKVDREFISGLGADAASNEIVSAVVQLAHALSMNVIAEGVETTQQREHVSRMGCEASQGYYFARPMRAESVTAMIERRDGVGSPRLPLPRTPFLPSPVRTVDRP